MPGSKLVLILLACHLMAGCGYQLAGTRPPAMKGIKTLYLEHPDNRTQHVRLAAKLGNHLVDAVIEDTRYRVADFEQADAKLVTKIREVEFNQVRSTRTDAYRPEELSMRVIVDWQVYSLQSSKLIMKGKETGQTRFYLNENLQTAHQNAFPDALKRVSTQIISSISNGF